MITVGYENYTVNGQLATTWSVPQYFAAGWHHTSAPPGQAGNTVLNGHQSIYGGVFQNLEALQLNDEIIIYAAGAAHRYRVAERHLVQEEGLSLAERAANVHWIMPSADERLTLVTCAPFSKTTHRLIIVALPTQ